MISAPAPLRKGKNPARITVAVADRHAFGGQAGQQPLGEDHFAFFLLPDFHRQGVVNPQLHENCGPDLSECRLHAPGGSLSQVGKDQRGVAHRELRAINANQPPRFVKGLWVGFFLRFRAQSTTQDCLENFEWQIGSTFAHARWTELLLMKQLQVLGHGASAAQ